MTDEELVEVAAKALAAENMGMADGSRLPDDLWQQAIPAARAVLAAVGPKIRADERERAAKIADKHERSDGSVNGRRCALNIAAAIRADNYGRNPPK